MTTSHPGYPTQPLKVGAPLPPETRTIIQAQTIDIQQELTRAEVELLYATSRHRKAWKAMKARLIEREELIDRPGGLAAIDSDPIWHTRTSDVAWWRDEMTAQATTILALKAILESH